MSQPVRTFPQNRRHRIRIALLLIGLALISAWAVSRFISPSTLELWQAARQAERDGNLKLAGLRADQVLAREPQNEAALLLAVRVSIQLQQWPSARGYLSRIANPIGQEAVATLSAAGEAFFQAGHVDPAENCFRRVLALEPAHLVSHTRLAFLLSCEGRRWEAVPHMLELLKQGQVSMDQLLWLGNLQAIVGDDALMNEWARQDADALGPRLGIAVRKLAQHDPVEAANRLLTLAEDYPDCLEVGIQLGKAALELSQLDRPSPEVKALLPRVTEAFFRWRSRHPSEGVNHPEWRVLQGRWLLLQQDFRGATRCFADAVELNPDQQFASYQLAQLFQREGTPSAAARCLHRTHGLDALFRTLNLIYDNRQHIDLMREAAEQTESLGRLWEAWGWYRMILAVDPKAEWAWQRAIVLKGQLDVERPPRVLSKANPIAGVDLQNYPIPDWPPFASADSNESPSTTPKSIANVPIQFADISLEAGIDFTYFNSEDDIAGRRSFEFTGGGIAVIDFDGDGWPDLYFTQGCLWPHQEGQRTHLDRLYRNVGGQRFEDVTAACGIDEDRFSQGAAVGDFNSDGFPDLYVANIGLNRFFRNNGDGTFTDVSEETGTAGNHWSTSCVLADVNADALPDLYVVNYLKGDDVFTRICHDPDGSARLCYPQIFPADEDLFYLNRGDGTFTETSESSGVQDRTGRGLGIVAADFEGTGKLNLFVANDTTANFYFRNRTAQQGGHPMFAEEGIASGLAFDYAGQPQAGMGVAAADADRDGRLDLVVTNFEKEYNNLYLQPIGGLFTDSIARSGMKDASYPMLGFGAQFLDADLDGWPDLFVANGHIDDFTRHGIPYRMPAQFFRNRGRALFDEQKGSELGSYFQGNHLGRAVARLDWNRDGRDDLAIGHLSESSVVLENRTRGAGRFFSLELRGVTSNRDAIGTHVELRAGGVVTHSQLTAGDGYQASNERRLVLGAGTANRVDELIVTWPGGLRQQFTDLPTDSAWLAIEGQSQPTRLVSP